MVAERSFLWDSTTQQRHLSYQHAATLSLVVVVIGYVRTQSGMHSPPTKLVAFLRNRSYYASAMEQNLCPLLHSISCMSLSTQLLALVH